MRWPGPQDYREAIQNPAVALSDEELRKAQLELDDFQLPLVRSGQYATVFKLVGQRSSFAVRCFLHNFEDRKERYRAISDFIVRDDLECTVGFELVDKGIRIGSDWYPILKMEYVDGSSLGSYVRQNKGNPDKLRELVLQFEEMMLALKSNGIAHGDLQHDNIVITPQGRLRLIDYDGMYVPALAGRHSNELGHRNYQHPSRNETHFGPNLDNYSAWIIRGALSTLAREPDFAALLENEESLLLTREDYLFSRCSRNFYTLEQKDNAARAWSRQIRTLLQETVDSVPYLDEELAIADSLPEIVPEDLLPVRIPALLPTTKQAREFQVVDCSSSEGQPVVTAASLALWCSEPVFRLLKPVLLCKAKSTDDCDQQENMLTLIEHTLPPGDALSWRGGLSSTKRSTDIQGQHIQSFPRPFYFWTKLWRRFLVLGGVFFSLAPVVVAVMCIANILSSRAAQASLFFGIGSLLILLFGLIPAFILIPFILLFSELPSPKIYTRGSGARHLLYALTDHSLKICVETDLRQIPGKDGNEWNVEVVDIPLYLIEAANFYNDSFVEWKGEDPLTPNYAGGFTERIELEIKMPHRGAEQPPIERLWLHGFYTWERLALKTRLRSLGVQCHEAERP